MGLSDKEKQAQRSAYQARYYQAHKAARLAYQARWRAAHRGGDRAAKKAARFVAKRRATLRINRTRYLLKYYQSQSLSYRRELKADGKGNPFWRGPKPRYEARLRRRIKWLKLKLKAARAAVRT